MMYGFHHFKFIFGWHNQLFISKGEQLSSDLFDDVIVLIQPWYNFFANGYR